MSTTPATQPTHLWIRSEARETERRAPVVPADVERLLHVGFRVTVEESAQRVFPIEEYEEVGAAVAPVGSWVVAPEDAYVVGHDGRATLGRAGLVADPDVRGGGRSGGHGGHCP